MSEIYSLFCLCLCFLGFHSKGFGCGADCDVGGVNEVRLDFIRDNAEAIMNASPVKYIRDSKVHGSLFNSKVTDGTVSCVDTQFFADHTEALEALQSVQEDDDWLLGELLDGHEFLFLVEARSRRSKSHSPRAFS